MNTRLLRRIQKHVLAEPRRLQMAEFVEKGAPGERIYSDGMLTEIPACGTTACIAGWACLLSNAKRIRNYGSRAAKLLGITRVQGSILFFTSGWPDQLAERYQGASTKAAQAEVLKERIDHFISSKGAR